MWQAYLEGRVLSVAMEFMEGGSLTDVVMTQQMDEAQIAVVCSQLIKALKYLHSKNIIHRDIKVGLPVSPSLSQIMCCWASMAV